MTTYVITSGDYSDYRIIAYVEGTNISACYEKFKTKFEIPDYPKKVKSGIEEYYEKLISSQMKMRSFYNEEFIYEANAFVRFLQEECGFVLSDDVEEFQI